LPNLPAAEGNRSDREDECHAPDRLERFDGFVKSQFRTLFVIPAKAGIQ